MTTEMRAEIAQTGLRWRATLEGRYVDTCDSVDEAHAAIVDAMRTRYGLIPAPNDRSPEEVT